MFRSLLKVIALVVAGSALLAGCGGGGSTKINTSGSSTATGNAKVEPVALPTTVISSVFDGKNDANQPLTILLQDDGSYFIVYSDATVPQNFLGVVLGAGTLASSSFSSSNALDLSLIGTGAQSLNAATLSGSYTKNQSINGTLSYSANNQTKSFTSSYNNTYETLPSLASLAGVYKGSIATKDVREDNIELTISPEGALSGKLTCGCSVAANLVPRADGTAYNATLAFTEGTNPLTGKAFAGNVYLDTQAKRLYIVGKISNTNDLAIFVGNKS
jgi:outer membrane murein-binding lipoprotein Lpp